MWLLLLRCFAKIPLPLTHFGGAMVGVLLWCCSRRTRRRIRTNAGYAGIHGKSKELLIAIHTGQGLLELPYVWFNQARALKKVRCDTQTLELITQQKSQGSVFLTPHWGCFEISARYYAQYHPVTALFKPPHKPWLLPIMEHARQTSQLKTAPATRAGVKQLFLALKRQQAVGILPDQVPSQGEGVWAPFFGQSAYTMTLATRLAQQTDAKIMLIGASRLSWGRGWQLSVIESTVPIPDSAEEQAQLINQFMETIILQAPLQYLWSYNRYKTPAGVTKP